VLSFPVIPEIDRAASDKQDKSESSSPKIEDPPAPKFSESEISRYNKLLARYFIEHSKPGAEAGSEPPSFKEWLKQGKKAF
jgi:hypothetical protein